MRIGICRFSQGDDDMCEHVLKTCLTETWWERSRGLLAMPELQNDEALWITPCNSVHTFGMSYALDLIYLNRSMQIIKLVNQCVPRTISGCWSARSVLEVSTGTIQRFNLQLGMGMVWEHRVST